MAWPAHLAPTHASMASDSSSSLAPDRSRPAQVVVLEGEQAAAELAVGGEADAVALLAERAGDARDHADLAAPVEVAEPLGGLGAPGDRLEREHRVDLLDDLGLGDDLVAGPGVAAVERHPLDEADGDAAVAAVASQVDDLVVVHAAHDDDVHLHRREARLEGGVDAVEHVGELVAPGELGEAIGLERVERDVHPPQAGVGEPGRHGLRGWRRWW